MRREAFYLMSKYLAWAKSFTCENWHRDLRFNERVWPDVIYLNIDPVLHVVDKKSHLSAVPYM